MQQKILDSIHDPKDLRKVPAEQLPELAKELRDFIINIVATKEGHLGASLGVVELTLALHYVFNTPDDLLVWDVGHQAYGHKILTGRRDVFHTNRQWNGISGFPKREESIYDTFGTGHSSTSISAALGMAIASRLQGNTERQHIAVVGDASIASGMAFEALNHAGVSNTNLLVILNDNAIGIDPSVGALKEYLSKSSVENVPNSENIFEALQFEYTGPIDGHDIHKLIDVLSKLKETDGPKVLHVITKKGKGLKQAEEHQITYHAPGRFDAKTGDLLPKTNEKQPPKFQDVFGKTLVELAQKNEKIIGITPAMPTGSSLKYMMDAFPNRAFDVGIAEQHAVTLAAGMATQGFRVYCTIYATFLQRAYDQVIHDVCLQKLPVVFCLDRAGLVGADGATHHGIFDIAFLRGIPSLRIIAPGDEIALRNMLYTVQDYTEGPIAIRYPRGRGWNVDWQLPFSTIDIGKIEKLKEGTELAIISVGTMKKNVEESLSGEVFRDRVAHFDLVSVKPLDFDMLNMIFKNFEKVITVEDGVIKGGVGEAIQAHSVNKGYIGVIRVLGIPDRFPQHGTVQELQDWAGISSEKIKQEIMALLP
ncbi:1-deoxy-D-xylulose-5-phosphate synthase [Flavobacteriaceae bacterium TK19130]|nr:1-deoxy-D-xylulose-5-phosphate synthase [Thermobacterium salinum]